MTDRIRELIRDLTRRFEAEVRAVNAERAATYALDGATLALRAAERTAFQRDCAALVDELARVLPPPEQRPPELQRALFEMKSWAALLREAEALTQALVRRAKPVLDGYLDATLPVTQAYDRRGHKRAWKHAAATLSTARISTKA